MEWNERENLVAALTKQDKKGFITIDETLHVGGGFNMGSLEEVEVKIRTHIAKNRA